nr:unnamed protein product [Digitaria exilis]
MVTDIPESTNASYGWRPNFNTRDFSALYNLGPPVAAVFFNCQRENGCGGRRAHPLIIAFQQETFLKGIFPSLPPSLLKGISQLCTALQTRTTPSLLRAAQARSLTSRVAVQDTTSRSAISSNALLASPQEL